MPYQPGDILLDKYRIEELIGKGAFAQVYRAEEIALQRTVAIKVLRKDTPGVGSQVYTLYRDRFQLEAQLGARIDSSYVIRVHTLEISDGDLYLVMEYGAQGSLRDRIEAVRTQGVGIPVDEVIDLGIGVARGLAELHRLDIVHRDVKPSNILISEGGQAKLADLGLVQTPESRIIRLGQGSLAANHPGTPEYMPPEQKLEQLEALRASADVYALGSTLFEALTGRMYFHQKPGTRARDLRPELPDWLDELLARMLAKDPEKRPWDGAEVAELLRTGQTVEARRKEEEQREAEENAQLAEEQAHREAERISAEIARLRREMESSITSAQWGRAEQLLAQLESQGEEGQAAADRLRVELTKAQRQAEEEKHGMEERTRNLSQLEKEFNDAIAHKNIYNARKLISLIQDLGEEGKTNVQSLEAKLDKLRKPTWRKTFGAIIALAGIMIVILAIIQ